MHAGFGDFAQGAQGDAARGFENGASGIQGDGGAQGFEVEIVEEQHGRAGGEGGFEFGEVFDFHLDETAAAAGAFGDGEGGGHGFGDAAGGDDVIFLDEDGVPERQAMIAAAADADGVFLRETQAGQGFARIDHFGLGAGHQIGVAARAGGDARKKLQEIQGAAFAGEQGARPAFEGA